MSAPNLSATRGERSDRPLALTVAFAFALSLGIAIVAIPLVALDAGYSPATIGFLVAVSAGSQLVARFALPWLLGRFADRLLITLAGACMLAGLGILLLTTELPGFLLAQAVLGASRALFWTASQTHALRSGGEPVKRLVDLNLAGNAGTLTGPVLAGLLATIGLPVAIAGAALAVSVTLIGAPLLRAFPLYDRRQSGGALRLLRREGVDMACWANVVGGVWWSMIGSYVPVILVGAGLMPSIIGLLVTLSEGAGAAMLVVLRRTPVRLVPRIVRAGAFTEMVALVAIALAPHTALAYAAFLILGGGAAGCVTGLAPALVALAAGEQEHGDALALSGTFRSLALLGAPALVGTLLGFVALPVAMIAIAAMATAPGLALLPRAGAARQLSHRLGPGGPS